MTNLDKVTHGAICAAGVALMKDTFIIPMEKFWLALLTAVLVMAAIGVIKEWLDLLTTKVFDKKDLLADGIGIALASLWLIFDWYIAL